MDRARFGLLILGLFLALAGSARAEPGDKWDMLLRVEAAPVAKHGPVKRRRGPAASLSLSGVVPQLAAKASEITTACGSTVISAVRHTLIAGTSTMSLHASGRAVDIKGNPTCIYAHLQGWPGGYSIDYGRVQHVHISLGGREDGLRFVHGGGHSRHAGHRHQRYAAAQ